MSNWAFPTEMQANPDEYDFDLRRALDSVVGLRAGIPADAFTASILGTERSGNGVVIRDDGLVLTIGYLITEASEIWLTSSRGSVLPGSALAYDYASGLGLVQPLGQLDLPALERGSSGACGVGSRVVVAGQGGRAHALKANVIGKHEFAGYWEYLLDEALFTAPAHPQWGGAALLGEDGRLLGVGSLLVEEQRDKGTVEGNMFVPIDLLEPILDDMLKLGRPGSAPRPWLGFYVTVVEDQLVIAGLAQGGPAERAALKVGDRVLEVAGRRVNGLAELFREIWKQGAAGVEVTLTLLRRGSTSQIRLRSADREEFLKKPNLH
ncbi:MAG: S1C family serine protease [Betaproteobacteria bacterium]|nr:S1C family serine protease [Betaproteobacteria bacterium]